MLVFEYVVNGNLRDFLRRCRPWQASPSYSPAVSHSSLDLPAQDAMQSDETAHIAKASLSPYNLVNFGHQIAAGMQFLAGHRIVHRDLAWYALYRLSLSFSYRPKSQCTGRQRAQLQDIGFRLVSVSLTSSH